MATPKEFFKLPAFVVVGASTEKAKFGNKVLRAYQSKGFKVTPINKKVDVIEGIPCEESLTSYSAKHPDVAKVGVSIVTPPAVTRQIVEEGLSLGYRNFFFQPGTVDHSVEAVLDGAAQAHFVQSCVLVELGIDDPHHF